MEVLVESRRKSLKTIERAYPGALVIDVTSKASLPWQKFSPFFPHGGIPVPFSPGVTAQSVEGIWQALKVFEHADVDTEKLQVTSMRGLKRTTRRFGRVLGHRKGINGRDLLSYLEARKAIYLPCYRFVLVEKLAEEVRALRQYAERERVVLLDYETNTGIRDLKRPLSHAGLVAAYLTDRWPPDQRRDPHRGE